MRKPSLTLRCVADTHAQPGERIAEFSFPAAAGGGNLPGGLISLRYREGAPPLVSIYRVEGCEVQRLPLDNAPPAPFAHDDEHPQHTRRAWRAAIGDGCTQGYWEWVKAQPERPRVELYETATGRPTGQFWPLDLGASLDTCRALANNHAAKLGPDYGVRVIGAPDEIAPGAFERCKLAGYRVEHEHTDSNGSWWWRADDPSGDIIGPHGADFWPTERAAWEACDRHRMFGDTGPAPAMANEGPTS